MRNSENFFHAKAQTWSRQRFEWRRVTSGNNVIVPITTMLQFPMVVNIPGDQRVINRYAIDFRFPGNGVTSTPMPSINVQPAHTEDFVVNVRYELFDSIPGSMPFTMTFRIIYEERNSHREYRGGNAPEIQGEGSWNVLIQKNNVDDHTIWIPR